MPDCPECGSDDTTKIGTMNPKFIYHCRACDHVFIKTKGGENRDKS